LGVSAISEVKYLGMSKTAQDSYIWAGKSPT